MSPSAVSLQILEQVALEAGYFAFVINLSAASHASPAGMLSVDVRVFVDPVSVSRWLTSNRSSSRSSNTISQGGGSMYPRVALSSGMSQK